MTDLADLAGGAPLSSASDLTLSTLLVAAAGDVVLAESQTDLTSNYAPTDGRVAIVTPTDTAYVADGSSWLDVQAAVAMDGLLRLARHTETGLPTAGTEGRLAWNSTRKVPAFEDGTDWEYPVVGDDVVTSSTTVANTTTETEVYAATLDSGSMQVGRVYEVNLFGQYSTNDSSDTFTFRFKVGGTTVATITSVAANVSGAPISMRLKFTVRATGDSGTIMVHTESVFNDAHSDVHHGTETIDTTTQETVQATVEWGVAESGDSLTIGQGYMKEVA